MRLNLFLHHCQCHNVTNKMMHRLQDDPTIVRRIFSKEQTHDRRLTNVQPEMPWIKARAKLICNVAISRIQLDFLYHQWRMTPYHLNRRGQPFPGHRRTQNIVPADHLLKCFYVATQTLAAINAEQRCSKEDIALAFQHMVEQNADERRVGKECR